MKLLIDCNHAQAAPQLPFIHKDPFDRMLIAQAQMEGLTLVTSDANMLHQGAGRTDDERIVKGSVGVTPLQWTGSVRHVGAIRASMQGLEPNGEHALVYNWHLRCPAERNAGHSRYRRLCVIE